MTKRVMNKKQLSIKPKGTLIKITRVFLSFVPQLVCFHLLQDLLEQQWNSWTKDGHLVISKIDITETEQCR